MTIVYKSNKKLVSNDHVIEQLRTLLAKIDPDVGYKDWSQALMVIVYETEGHECGLALADEWSSQGYKYRGCRDVAYRWKNFNIDYPRPVRMPTLVRMAMR